ncbi:hypothetical protein ANN_20752 [Periplaneta americana]|uniref:NAD(+) kinase n=1 Tax=Periplaneta americana TaxID=6978 RepID=A0ABQ8SEC4_PERAM|nr:hypothetical protein ANN_20752 [Periplaneta americana]
MCGQRHCSPAPKFCLKRALLVSKMTRYELECLRYPDLSTSKREAALRKQCFDYDVLLQHHNLHKEFEHKVMKTLNDCGIETRTVNRSQYTQSNIDWADIIIPTGGDGTFLMAASRVHGNEKPVVGLNSDPSRSEGYLCLPVKYSANIKEAVDKLLKGEFEWLFRSRIRITLHGENLCSTPIELHEHVISPSYRSLGYGTISFDGEIVAISESLRNLLFHINKFKNAVILSDSKAAILSIVSKHTPSSQTAEITKMLSQLISHNKRIVFQWIPSHCGILGNENADALAKKGSTATYRPVTKSMYYSVKRFIKSTYLDFNKQNLITQSQGKKWNSLHHNPQLFPIYHENHLDIERKEDSMPTATENVTSEIVPVLALNELEMLESEQLTVMSVVKVYMGESLSSRVSYFGLSLDNGVWTKVKSSGLCVSTGTGSTSWHLSINRITEQSVAEVMKLLGASQSDSVLVKKVTDEFNKSLIFSCEDKRMSYTIRDLISAGVWPDPKGLEPRGYANRIEVKSRCFDGGLVVDGGVFFKFNEGTTATLEVHDCDALRTVKLTE